MPRGFPPAPASRSNRVRSISNVGALSAEQIDVVEEVLLRSDVGLATTTALLEELRANGAPEECAAIAVP